MALMCTIFAVNPSTVSAHGDDSSKGDSNATTVDIPTADAFNFSVDSASNTATLQYADGTPLANASVTVKNGTAGQDGDIEQNQQADANGVFDYSKWIDKNVAVLRVTDPASNAAIELNIETGAMTIEAGKGSGGGSGKGGSTAAPNTNYIIGGVVAVVAVGTAVVVVLQKKKKAAFAAQAKAKGKGKGKGKADSKEKKD